MHVCGLCSVMKHNLFDSWRCEGDVSRSDGDCAETRNQSGHQILCDELAAQLVQRWESPRTCKTKSNVPVLVLLLSSSLMHPSILREFNFWIWPLRRRPQARNAPDCHSDVWGDGGSCQRLRKHTSGCGEDQDAGRKRTLCLILLPLSGLPFLRRSCVFFVGFRRPPLQTHNGLCLPDLEARRTTSVSDPPPAARLDT